MSKYSVRVSLRRHHKLRNMLSASREGRKDVAAIRQKKIKLYGFRLRSVRL